MNVRSFLSVVTGEDLKVSILEDGTELIKFYVGGSGQLSTELLDRTIESITIMGKSYIRITLSTS